MAIVPEFQGSIGFNAQHSPHGAFFSFTCGHPGTRGGFGIENGKPGDQNIFIGVKNGAASVPGDIRVLPFYEGAQVNAADAFTLGQQQAEKKTSYTLKPYDLKEIRRRYGWATDTWRTQDLHFQIVTPFGFVRDPAVASPSEMRRALLPAVVAELRVDNREGKEPKTGFFALGFPESAIRVIDGGLRQGRCGFAYRNYGVAAELFDVTDGNYLPTSHQLSPFVSWNVESAMAQTDNRVHLLGQTGGIMFEVPPGKCYAIDIALGCHLPHVVTTRIEGRYFYTRYFANLVDVLDEALNYGYTAWKVSDAIDRKLIDSGLSVDQQFLISHATRSYYGSTQLLDVGGQPFWIVNEGEYCMINTLDLSVDQMFWEAEHMPWALKNLLCNFVHHYSYHDQVIEKRPDGVHSLKPGGISFCHDMGVRNQFSPHGHSSYEMAHLTGCFSQMTCEQLCNWILIATTYVAATNDLAWLHEYDPIITACLRSMLNRAVNTADPDGGLPAYDSSRCGTGQEITTYDSLDHSLAQTRRNAYMAVKCWGAYIGLTYLFTRLNEKDNDRTFHGDHAFDASNAAKVIEASLLKYVQADGTFPAVLEKENPGWNSRILPAVEGLVYPLFWGQRDKTTTFFDEWLSEGGHSGALIKALKKHTSVLLADPHKKNHFADGGLRLSSTSSNSWMSKIAIFQHVARMVFKLDENGIERQNIVSGTAFAKSDQAHVKWETDGESAYWACSDQMVDGVAKGSKYYPRIITTALWLEEKANR